MTTVELKKLLAAHGIRPIRDRGQHFLLDERVVDKMLDAAKIGEGSRVVEIGPGPGILTEKLLSAGAEVAAVELDQKLCSLLRDRFPQKNFHLMEGDALEVSNDDLAGRSSVRGAYAVVANIPYAITSALLQKFLLEEPKPAAMTIMIQREVADRILAKPGKMSSLAVLVQTLGEPRRVANVPASAFFPPPKVDSAVIHIVVREEESVRRALHAATPDRYFAIVRAAFADPRKQLKNTVRAFFPDERAFADALKKANISEKSRPQELSVAEWAALASPPEV